MCLFALAANHVSVPNLGRLLSFLHAPPKYHMKTLAGLCSSILYKLLVITMLVGVLTLEKDTGERQKRWGCPKWIEQPRIQAESTLLEYSIPIWNSVERVEVPAIHDGILESRE